MRTKDGRKIIALLRIGPITHITISALLIAGAVATFKLGGSIWGTSGWITCLMIYLGLKYYAECTWTLSSEVMSYDQRLHAATMLLEIVTKEVEPIVQGEDTTEEQREGVLRMIDQIKQTAEKARSKQDDEV